MTGPVVFALNGESGSKKIYETFYIIFLLRFEFFSVMIRYAVCDPTDLDF